MKIAKNYSGDKFQRGLHLKTVLTPAEIHTLAHYLKDNPTSTMTGAIDECFEEISAKLGGEDAVLDSTSRDALELFVVECRRCAMWTEIEELNEDNTCYTCRNQSADDLGENGYY
jgi:hypothetical protein